MGVQKALVADQAGGLTFCSVRPPFETRPTPLLGLVSLSDTQQSPGFVSLVSCDVLISEDCDGCWNPTDRDSFQLKHVPANHTWLLESVWFIVLAARGFIVS